MRPEQEKLRFVPLQMTLKELTELPEYSLTLPTGTTVGKRWRAHPIRQACTCHCTGKPDPSCTQWSVGEYCPSSVQDSVDILWRPVVIVTRHEKKQVTFPAPSRPELNMGED